MSAIAIEVSPLNPINVAIGPFVTLDTAGVEEPISTGTFQGFLATSDAMDATAADGNFSVAMSYIGGANGHEAGTWQYQLSGSVLTIARCEAAFGTSEATIWLVVTRDGVVRGAVRLLYKPKRRIEVAA